MYISAKSNLNSSNYIFAYQISNDSFTQYKFADSTLTIYDIAENSASGRFMFYGTVNHLSVYVFHALMDSILDFEDMSEDTSQIFSVGNVSDYQLSSTSYSNPSDPTNQYNSVSNTLHSVEVSGTMSITTDEYRDLVYYFNDPTTSDNFSLIENWNETFPISITCSINDSISLQHIVEGYDNYTAPDWVTIDEENNQISCSAPDVTETTNYNFRIRSNEINSSVYYYIYINLTVMN